MTLWQLMIDVIKKRRLPMIAFRNSHGRAKSKCPFCGRPVTVSKVIAGMPAFKCDACGETATWMEE